MSAQRSAPTIGESPPLDSAGQPGSQNLALGDRGRLVSDAGQVVGYVRLESHDAAWWHGSFEETAEFAQCRGLFDEHLEIVNNQLFSFLDEIEGKIDALRLRLSTPNQPDGVLLRNVQIGCGEISFQLPA